MPKLTKDEITGLSWAKLKELLVKCEESEDYEMCALIQKEIDYRVMEQHES